MIRFGSQLFGFARMSKKLPTFAVIFVKGDDLVNDFDIGMTATLRLANLLRISSPLLDEIVDIEHGALLHFRPFQCFVGFRPDLVR
jgi:hypothetical protein